MFLWKLCFTVPLIVIQYHPLCKRTALHLNCVFWAAFNNCRFVQFAVIADVKTSVFLTLAPPISPDPAAAREHAVSDMEELNHVLFSSFPDALKWT